MPKANKRSKSSSKDRSKKEKSDKLKTSKPEDIIEKVVEEVVDEIIEEVVVEEVPVLEKKQKSKKSSKSVKGADATPAKAVVADDGAAADAPAVEDGDTPAVDTVTVDGKRQRRVVTKESVLEDFDLLLKEIETEVEALRNPDAKKTKSKGVKFTRMVGKRVKGLRNDAGRVMRTRKVSTRPKNTSSGFMKPVQISSEMADFTGWEPDVPRSRVDVTKYLCQYIREHDLQNPEDRRIIRPDSQLKSLLKLQDSEKNPLTYYSLQKSIQHHFTNGNKAAVPAV
jgi:upstream activation factor subunit UAF30